MTANIAVAYERQKGRLPWSATSHLLELSAKSATFASGRNPISLKPSEKSKISCSSCQLGVISKQK